MCTSADFSMVFVHSISTTSQHIYNRLNWYCSEFFVVYLCQYKFHIIFISSIMLCIKYLNLRIIFKYIRIIIVDYLGARTNELHENIVETQLVSLNTCKVLLYTIYYAHDFLSFYNLYSACSTCFCFDHSEIL